MSWDSVRASDAILEINQTIDVMVLEIDDATGNLVVGLKQMVFVPWDNAESKYPIGTRAKVKVLDVKSDKVIVALETTIEGVIAREELAWGDHIPTVSEILAVGQEIEAVVLGFDPSEQRVSLSMRLLQPDPLESIATLYPVGSVVVGKVTKLVEFGAFIWLREGIKGLLHVNDISWGRHKHPGNLFKVGQDLEVVVLGVEKEKKRVALGLKQRLPNPWDNIEAKFRVGQKVKGEVINLVPYGAFVELEPGVEGLVHVTELSWTKRVVKPSDLLKQDQQIEAVVLGINRDEQKISLGVRQLETNPWDTADQKYTPGLHVKGKIRNLTSYGAFIELEDGLDGMIHVSDISWTRKLSHPSEVLKKGDDIESQVLEVDKPNQRIALGLKQLSQDPWDNIDQIYKVGDLVTGKITKLCSFGAFIGLQHDIHGLVHVSQVSEERVDKIRNVLTVGQDVTARVIKIDKGDRRIGLSLKAATS
jgi:small subunit ribosomal protein S1